MKTIAFCAALLFPAAALAEGGQPGAHFILNWDLDQDGIVTLAELTQKRDDVFYGFDTDENGIMDPEEYGRFDEARAADMANQGGHGSSAMGKVQEGMTLTFNDTDGDGSVSLEEFLSRTPDWLALIDRDGSGDVTPADFGPRA